MTGDLFALAAALERGEEPSGVQILKRSPLRCVALADGVVIKVLHTRLHGALRERRALERARALGVPVPEVVASGVGWLATRFAGGRPATRDDLGVLLKAIAQMHEQGMLHRDLHLGNLRITARGPVFLDVQKAIFLRRIPRWLRDRELGYFAYSLGDPLPIELAGVALWRTLRAQRHWRSRTRRCLVESSGFTRFECAGRSGWRRREIAEDALLDALRGLDAAPALKDERATRLVRSGAWIGKRHRSARRARAAWIAGHGLEMRGIATGRPVAWWGRWLLMDDAGPTFASWVDAEFARSAEPDQLRALEAVAELLARLHTRGIYHADLKANNVAWTPGATPRLLDYGRVRFGLRVSRRRRIKNLAQLNAALPDVVPSRLRSLALYRYLAALGGPPDDAPLRDAVVRESLRRAHRWSGS